MHGVVFPGMNWLPSILALNPTNLLCLDFNGDKDYFDNKVKRGSLGQIFKQRKVPDALAVEDKQYIFIDNLNPDEFYNPNNNFN